LVPTKEQLLNFLKKHNLPNLSKIAKHFNIQNSTVSDLVKDLEERKLVNVVNVGGSKVVQVKEDKMKKRGQVTTFVILGILILAVLGITLYLINTGIKSSFEREQERISVNSEFIPLKNYFDSCIQNVASGGALVLGMQGGYIDIPENNMPITPVTPFSNKLQVFNNNALEVPYWFYETANGIQKTQIPSKREMENSLQNYISNNLNNCLSNFTAFQDYSISGFDDVDTEVSIQSNQILITINSKLTVEYKGLTQEFSKFLISLDSPLGELYDLSNEIFDEETKTNFLEQQTYDMMVVYDEIPLSETEFSCEQKIWSKVQVERDFKGIVSKNLNAINLKNSNLINSKKYFALDIDANNANAVFSHSENWPFKMDVYPSENGVLKGDQIIKQTGALRFLSSFLCINNYNFVYDVKYPTLITLNKNGYTFQYAYLVILDNNQPKINVLGTTEPEEVFNLCDKKITNTKVNTYTINENDELTPLNDALISFKCFSNTCEIGKTGNGYLEEAFPQCINGQVIAEKDGYHRNALITSTNQESTLSLVLERLYEKELEIRAIDKNTGEITSLLPNEQAIVDINGLSNDYSTLINYPDTNKVDLVTGEYEITIYINSENKNGIRIEGGDIENCVSVPKEGILGLFFDETKCVTTTLDSFVLDQALIGGVKFNAEFILDDIVTSNKIILYAIVDNNPKTNEDLIKTYDSIEANDKNQYFKYPEFIR